MTISKNLKTTIYIIIVLLILGGAVYAARNYGNDQEAINMKPADVAALEEAERIRVLEIQLKDLESQASKLPAEATDSDKYTVYIQLAEVQIGLNKNQEALDSLNKIPEASRNNTRVWTAFALAYRGLGDIAQAKTAIQTALDIDNELASVWVPYLAINSDLPADQLNGLYRQAIVATKSNVDVMVSYAHFCEKIGDKATAIAAWETAINVDSANEAKYRDEIARLNQ